MNMFLDWTMKVHLLLPVFDLAAAFGLEIYLQFLGSLVWFSRDRNYGLCLVLGKFSRAASPHHLHLWVLSYLTAAVWVNFVIVDCLPRRPCSRGLVVIGVDQFRAD
ncbi:hypothetical protein Droror1_Dr00005710 [Drosera rotundifolia]